MRLLLDRALQSKVKAKINLDLLPFQCKSLRCMVRVINGSMSSGPSERIKAKVVKKALLKLHCNGQFPLTLTCSPWLWKPGDLDDHLHLLVFYDLCDLHHIPDNHDFHELINYDFRPFVVIELHIYNARRWLFSISVKSARGGTAVSKRYSFTMESTQY